MAREKKKIKVRVGIIGVGDPRHMAQISFYSELFDREGIAYELICMDRYGEGQNFFTCKTYLYPAVGLQQRAKATKIGSFLGFKRFAQRLINKQKYDFLVIWNENTCVLLSDYLIRNYRGRYCINVRDVNFPKEGIISMTRSKTIRESAFSTFVAPYEFDYPKDYEYTLMLSQNNKIMKLCKQKENFVKPSEQIRISFIGVVRFPENDLEFLRFFANDKRYLLQFFGAGSERYEYLVTEKGYSNIVLSGLFPAEKTAEYLNQTDVINAYYGSSIPDFQLSYPAKFGYAPYLCMPSIVAEGSYLSEVCDKYGFGFSMDSNDVNVADKFWDWYHSLDFGTFKESCNEYVTYVQRVNEQFEKKCLESIERALKNTLG